MPVVQVLTVGGPTEFGYETPDELVAAIADHLPDYEVQPWLPGRAGRGPDWYLEIARQLIVSLPWEVIGPVVLSEIASAFREWLTERVRAERQRIARSADPVESRAAHMFPQDASSDEKASLLRTTPYRVTIVGPRDEVLAVVEQTQSMEQAEITRTYQA